MVLEANDIDSLLIQTVQHFLELKKKLKKN
jgi:hypothetical protein